MVWYFCWIRVWKYSRSRASNSVWTSVAEVPATVTTAMTETASSAAEATDTEAPMGRLAWMASWTSATISGEAASKLLSTTVTPTVPAPVGSSTTLASPTPGTSMAQPR